MKTVLMNHFWEIYPDEGDMLYKGDKIGHMGASGNASGPHVHVAVAGRELSGYWRMADASNVDSTEAITQAFVDAFHIQTPDGVVPAGVTVGGGWDGYPGHKGIDVVAKNDEQPAYPLWPYDAPGTVVEVDQFDDGGNYLVITWDDEAAKPKPRSYASYPPGQYWTLVDLNIRTAPAVNAELVCCMPPGELYTAIAEVRQGVDGVWHKRNDGYYCCCAMGASVYVAVVDALKPGDRVRLKAGSGDYHGTPLDDWVYNATFDLQELDGNRAVIGMDGRVTAAVDVRNLTRA